MDGYLKIFVDSLSKWDIMKYEYSQYTEADWENIVARSDVVLSERAFTGKYGKRVITPLEWTWETKADELIYIEDRIPYTNHYMRTDECICGMLSILRVMEECGDG